jgi:DNA-binding winged helix-turn-helix (wHTH) protein
MQQSAATPTVAHPFANRPVAARLGARPPAEYDSLHSRTGKRVVVVNMVFLLSGVGWCRGATVVPGAAFPRCGRACLMLYTFHDYVLDPQRHELRQQGVPLPLEHKAYQVLVYLVQHADRLVTKRELLDAVWPEVYINDSAVARCIGAVRQAVGDRRDTQGVIRTVHGQGYRFVAQVVAHPNAAGAPPESAPAAAPAPPAPLVGRAASA